MDPLHRRVDALEHQIHTLHQRSRAVERRLRWWRGIACGLLVGALLTCALPSITAHEDARGGQQGLADRVAALETLLTHFTRVDNEVVITGANLRLVNGLGSTACTDDQGEPILDCPNGLGNLIVGYNEQREFGANMRTGSHNVVVGPFHNFSRVGGLVVGDFNEISGDFAVVSGGQRNTASGDRSVVSGGVSNTASGGGGVVSGGFINTASGFATVVSGGSFNTASGAVSSVSGGQGNEASNDFASVSGGRHRTAPGEFNWVAGSLFEDK
jgi:trimeric autotransporter adhesin